MKLLEYGSEKAKIIRTIVIIIMMVTTISIFENIFISETSIPMLVLDMLLLFILLSLFVAFERIISNKLYLTCVFALFPLVYFPMAWINSGGLNGVGILYFFLFASVIIYMKKGRGGLLVAVLMVVEIVILIMLEKFHMLNYSAIDSNTRYNMYLFNFPVVGVGYSLLYYFTIRKHFILHEKVYDSSLKDYLTNTFNRRYLIAHIEKLLNNGTAEDAFYLVFFDLNNFKQINDTYGHHKGDEVLIMFSNCVISMIRRDDIFGRYGGDEFLLIISKTSHDNVQKLEKRIERRFSDLCIQELGYEVTVSAGIVSGQGKSAEEIISFADEKMYRNKMVGKS